MNVDIIIIICFEYVYVLRGKAIRSKEGAGYVERVIKGTFWSKHIEHVAFYTIFVEQVKVNAWITIVSVYEDINPCYTTTNVKNTRALLGKDIANRAIFFVHVSIIQRFNARSSKS